MTKIRKDTHAHSLAATLSVALLTNAACSGGDDSGPPNTTAAGTANGASSSGSSAGPSAGTSSTDTAALLPAAGSGGTVGSGGAGGALGGSGGALGGSGGALGGSGGALGGSGGGGAGGTGEAAPIPGATVPNLLVAFIGDQGANGNSDAVLNLIKAEKADAVVHNGDFDYGDDPTGWDDRITGILGESYPYFAVVGNHDAEDGKWEGSNGYSGKIAARHALNPEMQCTGELGVKSNCNFRGLHLLVSCIGTDELRSSCAANSSEQTTFIESSLAADKSVWSICNWHKNQRDMQVGTKDDEVGWPAYQHCMKAGAMVMTGHEHSYSRTKTLTDVGNAAKGHGQTGSFDDILLGPGRNFVAVSGLAGQGIRSFSTDYHDDDTWWASYYTSDRWMKSGELQSGKGNYGALFIRFHVAGNPKKAHAYYKDVSGRIVDDFKVTAP